MHARAQAGMQAGRRAHESLHTNFAPTLRLCCLPYKHFREEQLKAAVMMNLSRLAGALFVYRLAFTC